MTDTSVAVQQQKGQHPLVVLRERLESRKGELRSALPSDINPDRFIRALMTSAQINPDILACSWNSLWLACMRACRDGLLPDGVEGAIVPYKEKATWIPMYRGLLKKFQESGKFKWITANVVYEGDEFSHWIDEYGEHLKHVPSDRYDVPVQRVYAMATTKDGGVFVTVMPIGEINKIRGMSKARRDDSPWQQWPQEMMKKTALRRISKMLPSAPQLDEEDEEEAPAQLRDVTSMEPRQRMTAASALDAIGGSSALADEQSDGAHPIEERGDDVRSSPADSGAATAEPQATDPILLAYQRGQDAKKAGQDRKTLPQDYRDPSRDSEATAWLAGFDGQPQPNSKGDKS